MEDEAPEEPGIARETDAATEDDEDVQRAAMAGTDSDSEGEEPALQRAGREAPETEEPPDEQDNLRRAEAPVDEEETAAQRAPADGGSENEDDQGIADVQSQARPAAEPEDDQETEDLQAQPAPGPDEPPPEDAPRPEELASEAPPSTALAMRRKTAAPLVAAGGSLSSRTSEGMVVSDPASAGPPLTQQASEPAIGFGPGAGDDVGFTAHVSTSGVDPVGLVAPPIDLSGGPPLGKGALPHPSPERPQVVIDQVDVVIHEPVQALAGRSEGGRPRSRSIDARYLRRL